MNSSKSTSTIIVADRIPRYVQYTSPAVSTIPPKDVGPRAASALPLNLIAHIVSYIDEIGDLARVTRASRLLYYMTLPQLYRRVTLHSYGEMRYVNGRPEGFGSGSPFMMALNGLTTKSHATLVEDFRVWVGEAVGNGRDALKDGCEAHVFFLLVDRANGKSSASKTSHGDASRTRP
jgi:hypothetical protein